MMYFSSLTDAEEYQDALYAEYDCVCLVRAPLFGESGFYAWIVE